MIGPYLGLVINIIVMGVAILSIWKDIYINEGQTKNFQNFSKSGKAIIIAAVVFVVFNLIKDISSDKSIGHANSETKSAQNKLQKSSDTVRFFENQINAKSDSLKSDQDKLQASSDSLHKSQIELQLIELAVKDTIIKQLQKGFYNNIKASNNQLLKYNSILVDSMDRLTTKINLKSINLPQLSFTPASSISSPFSIRKDSNGVFLDFKLTSLNNISYNIFLNCFFLKEGSPIFSMNLLDIKPQVVTKKALGENIYSTSSLNFKSEWLNLDELILFVSGTFSSDEANTKKIPFFYGVYFNLKLNHTTGFVPIPIADVIQKALIEKKLLLIYY